MGWSRGLPVAVGGPYATYLPDEVAEAATDGSYGKKLVFSTGDR